MLNLDSARDLRGRRLRLPALQQFSPMAEAFSISSPFLCSPAASHLFTFGRGASAD